MTIVERVIERLRRFGSPEPTIVEVPSIELDLRPRKELHDTRDRVQTLHNQLRVLQWRYRNDAKG